MTPEERIDLVESLAMERRDLHIKRRALDDCLGEIRDHSRMKFVHAMVDEYKAYPTDALVGLISRTALTENAEYQQMCEGLALLEDQISALDIKLERERSLVSLDLWQPERVREALIDSIS